MQDALEEANSAAACGNHPFGAVLVVDGAVVLKAQNSVMTDGDPTCHAEINLVRLACKTLGREEIARATMVRVTAAASPLASFSPLLSCHPHPPFPN